MKQILHRVVPGALLLFAAALPAAADVPWKTARVTVHAPEQRSVADVLKDFAATQGLQVSISPAVIGVVSGEFNAVPTESMLNTLCEAGNCIWFFDGGRLFIDSADESLTRTIVVNSLTRDALEDALVSVGFASGPAGKESVVKGANKPSLLLLFGGPRYIEATAMVAKELDSQQAQRAETAYAVRTYRLKYANAIDINVRSGDQSTQVPGVATLLQNLMLPQAGRAGSSGPIVTDRARNQRGGLGGTGLTSMGDPTAASRVGLSPQQYTAAAVASARGGANQGNQSQPEAAEDAIIVGDPRLNAIIVRDLAVRIPMYDEVIKLLDVPSLSIEITASVVDVIADGGFDVGVEFLGNYTAKDGNKYRFGFDADKGRFDGNDNSGETPSFIDGANLVRGAGFNATALIGGKGFDLLARLRTLETEGTGQIISSPAVLTMENTEAIIRTEETLFVRVAGQEDVDLFDVTAGVILRVTPTLIEEADGTRSCRLQLDIQDGNFDDSKVDEIPTKQQSAITTQALVPENKTLLVGGYFVERKSDAERRVPFLGRIPVIGYAFKHKQVTKDRRQRFFFITPRVVTPSKEARPAVRFKPTMESDRARKLANDAWSTRDPGPPLPEETPPKAVPVVDPYLLLPSDEPQPPPAQK